MSTRTVLTTATLLAALTASVPAASAHEARPTGGHSTEHVSPYAEPDPALGGRMLAQYVAEHVAHRITVH